MPQSTPGRGSARADGLRKKKVPKQDRYYSRAIGNALKILGMIRGGSTPLSLSQITSLSRLPKSSVFRILRTLEITGYLEKAGRDLYIFSPLLVSSIPDDMAQKLVKASEPLARMLNREFRETVSVACLFANHIEVVLALPSPQKLNMGNITGSIIPPHASSLGKSIVANQPEARREHLLRTFGICRFTPQTVTDEVELSKQLQVVRENGYATDFEESSLEGCCFGAPIIAGGWAVGAISSSMPKTRCKDPDKYIAALKSAASAISSQI